MKSSSEGKTVEVIQDRLEAFRGRLEANIGPLSLSQKYVIYSALVTLCLASRPYQGIVHDARLYLVQALYRLEPEKFGADLFFKFGSQDSFSVFSLIYAPAVALFDPGGAHLLFWILGQVLWGAALVYLSLTLFGVRKIAILGIGAAYALSPNYGWGALQYGEPFVTPRIFVEAISITAIALVNREKVAIAYAISIVAVALHPLMALPGLAVVALLTLPLVRVLIPLVIVGILTVSALALAGIEPFTRATARFDAEWFEIVYTRSPHAFIQQWGWHGITFLSLPFSSLALVAWRGDIAHRPIAKSILAMGLGFLLVSWLGGEIFANVLVLNLQLWRGLWLVTLLGNIFAIYAVCMLPTGGRSRIYLIAAIIVNVIEAQLGSVPVVTALIVVVAGLEYWADCYLSGKMYRAMQLVGSAAMAAATLVLFANMYAIGMATDVEKPITILWREIIILAAGVGLIAWCLGYTKSARVPVIVSTVLLVWSISIVDMQEAKAKYVSSSEPPDTEIFAQIEGRNTYWEDGVEIMWFKMRQPIYYSCIQGAGVMFYRETAIEHIRLGKIFRNLNTSDFDEKTTKHCLQKGDPLSEGPTTPEQILAVCNALPELDIMVLHAEIPELPHGSWKPEFHVPPSGFKASDAADLKRRQDERQSDGLYFIYDCHELRGL